MIMIAGVISMIKIKNEDVEFLKKHIFDNDTEKLDKLLNSKNINDLLIELNDWLAFEGLIKTTILIKLGFGFKKSTITFMQIMNNGRHQQRFDLDGVGCQQIMNNIKFGEIYENEIKSIEEII